MQTRLEKVSLTEHPGLRDMLLQLGPGDSGYGGTAFATGELSMPAFLQHCIDQENPAKLQPGYVPQTNFWILDDSNTVVGSLRLRHYLNDALLQNGGHIGYYIAPPHRNKSHATRALSLALIELKKLGVHRALITPGRTNLPSQKVTLANGGILEPPAPTDTVLKYWIDLSTG
jgi:predicted acetyltransferase